MKTINHICAIFIKQIKDSLKNRLVLVVFFYVSDISTCI